MICSPEDFVKIWQSSKNLDEVVKRTGMKRGSASGRAVKYRKNGVPLRMFECNTGGAVKDWKALAKLAASVKR